MDTIDLTKKLIEYPSVTPAHQDIFDFAIKLFKENNFEIYQKNFSGDGSYEVINLFAIYNKDKARSGKHFNFACHFDVVPPGDKNDWTFDPFTPTEQDGYLYGRGSEDMKGCTAASMIASFKFIKENKNFDGAISFIITGDEEADSINGVDKLVNWIKDENLMPEASIATESSSKKILGDQIKVGRKGATDIHLEIIGKQGHAAYPQLAHNPVHCLSKIISNISDIELDKGNEFFEKSSLQFTQLELNNKAKNVIPEKVKAIGDCRFNDLWSVEKLEKLLIGVIKPICEENSCTYKLNFVVRGLPFHSFDNPVTKNCLEAIKSVTGIEATQDTGGGTSDARFIQRICPVIEFGTINDTLHKIDERVSIDDLQKTEKIYYETLKNYFND